MGAARRNGGGLSFEHLVWRVVRRVPRGRVVTYGQVAAVLGHPRAARGVGRAMRDCPPDVPWHRVVNARGEISPRPRMAGMMTQQLRLEQEGVTFRRGRIVLARHAWSRAAAAGRSGAPNARARPARGTAAGPPRAAGAAGPERWRDAEPDRASSVEWAWRHAPPGRDGAAAAGPRAQGRERRGERGGRR